MRDQETPSTNKVLEWSAADLEWLASIPLPLQPTAKRYGRKLFSLVMQAGMTSHAIELISRRTRGNREMMQATALLAQSLNQLCGAVAESWGNTPQEFISCREDIERVAVLAGGALEGRTPGGILLTN